MKRYSIIFPITHSLDASWMIFKQKGLFLNCWNAPSGKIEPGETSIQCAVRELKEETNLSLKDFKGCEAYMDETGLPHCCYDLIINSIVHYLVTLTFEHAEFNVYYTILNKDAKPKQMEEEAIQLIYFTDITSCWNSILAGDGNIPYFIRLIYEDLINRGFYVPKSNFVELSK